MNGTGFLAAAAVAVLAATTVLGQVPTVELRPGLVITRSVRVAPKTYRLPAPSSVDSAVIVVRGDDLTVDFTGVTLEGSARDADPDARAGVAIRVDGGRGVRIRNARVRGYKVGIVARGTRDLTLADNDLSDNWKPRLFSGIGHESLVDWMSYHRNENDEWLRFGAAVYLADVQGGELRGNRVERGMNGILLVRSDSLRIWNNVVSFNSGIGFGLYRSSDNTIMHNHADYNVRGYSHGYYKRGQDSAALLIYEQSCRNVVAYNSMTHSGDGLFLWAGQSTMDNGEGGANDNLFYGNDFSFAPTNGMEATFSRNTFIANRIEGSDHGLWGGYSFDSKVIGNDFRRNRVGIAIEHGQSNDLSYNRFAGDTTAIYLWANRIEPSDWGYPKHRDTRSRDYRVAENVFYMPRVAVRGSSTRGMRLTGNRTIRAETTYVLADTSDWTIAGARDIADTTRESGRAALRAGAEVVDVPALPAEYARVAPRRIPGALEPFTDSLALRPRSAIVVTEWGPYDWRAPLLWPADSGRGTRRALRVLGPPGRWHVVRRTGIAGLSRERGRTGAVGDTVVVTPAAGTEGEWELTLEYTPDRPTRSDTTARFSFRHFEPPIRWTARVYTWPDSTADPLRDSVAFAAVLSAPPAFVRETRRLDFMWYRPTIQGIPQERFAIEATGTVTLGPGTYTLRTISDDGVRVWVDGRLTIDSWAPHESKVDNAPIGPGAHEIRVRYYQLRGWTELALDILRGTHRSEGSPGPH
jgi:parallel beta-helix repeat protein